MFQEFQLSITHLGENRYFLRTEKVAAGVPLAEEQVVWDVDQWITEAQHLMSDPLSRLLQGTGRLSEHNRLVTPETDLIALSATEIPAIATTLLEFGQKLHKALFVGSVKESWSKAQAIAHHQNHILRLRLGFKEARLLSLPWEVMNAVSPDTIEVQSVTTGIETSFSRYYSTTHGEANPPSMEDVQEQTLNILMVLASPADQDRLELRQEAEHLQRELEKETTTGIPPLTLTILDNPGRQELTEILEQGKYHQGQYQVFHYAGHSNLGHFGGDIYLVNRETGLTEPFAGDDLAGLLANNGVQFAIFNSCHGADGITNLSPERSEEKNLARALIKRGIPAVLAMSAQIPDQVALTFTRLLYRNLHQGYPLDFSLGRVRQGLISAYGSHQLYWALPVLNMSPDFHGLLHHRRLNTSGLAELMHRSDLEVISLSPEDEALLAIAPVPMSDENFWLEEDSDSLFSPPRNSDFAEPDTDFIRDTLDKISADLQDLKGSQPDKSPGNGFQIPASVTGSTQASYRWQIIGGTLAAIALGSFLLIQHNRNTITIPLDPTGEMTTEASNIKLDTEMLLTAARNQSNDWAALQEISTKLLNAQAMPQAEIVLYEIANPETADLAELSFLRGRFAWQQALKEVPVSSQPLYSYDDVRRFWLTANDKQGGTTPNPQYLSAIAFTYYQEANYDQAIDTWSEVIALDDGSGSLDPQLFAESYAGLAISLYKNSQQAEDPALAQELLSKAEKVRNRALTLAPEQLSLKALTQNWLWSQEAIAAWEELLSLQ